MRWRAAASLQHRQHPWAFSAGGRAPFSIHRDFASTELNHI